MSKSQSSQLDEQAPHYGLSAETLMENAGSQAAQWILSKYSEDFSFVVLCGPGHNGGDGWVLASSLKKAGRNVQVFSCKSSNELWNIQRKKCLSLGLFPKNFSDFDVKEKEVIIDALFGVGLDRKIEGEFFDLIFKINKSSSSVVALDLPSGLCADTGSVLGIGVKASQTLSFALPKPGFYLNQGPAHCGEIQIFSIGFPKELLSKVCGKFFLISSEHVCSLLPVYKEEANKTHRGHTLIGAGREGMWGSAVLACEAAFRVGSGYVTWASEEYPKNLEIPEALTALLGDKNLLHKKTSVALGPGLGFSSCLKELILRLKEEKFPVLLDADAITLCAKEHIFNLGSHFLLTPHSGELSRLLEVSSENINKDRLLFAEKGASQMGAWLLLKGFHSVLSDGEKSYILNSGNSALGKAGTGDVLTGIISGLAAQGLGFPEAAALGAVLHGETAEKWCREGKDVNAFSASDILRLLPSVISEMRTLC